VLAADGKIVAVLDWDCAAYGDWLFDVAGAYYWRGHLMCMDVQARYYERELAQLPNYRERIDCYQLRAALIEMYVNAQRRDLEKLSWHSARCQEILDGRIGASEHG
jgi:hygromycin-B 4-O-kinase